tara:strand:+ start:763 stop:993 length:231 start_codon:yes stop_codon:yes gene_type:complete
MIKEHTKVFTGTSVLVNRLTFLLDNASIPSLTKDNVESAILGGFGTLPYSVELFIFNSDVEKATPIIEEFKKEIAK